MSLYAFTDAQGNVEVLVDCPDSQIDIQPYNQELPLRFDVTGQINGWQETDLLCVNIKTGKVEFKPAPPPPAPTDDELATEARLKRNDLLMASDWTQMPDAPVNQAAWATYRQDLRDLPQQPGFPNAVVWPDQPVS
jgi:hypothetical protein